MKMAEELGHLGQPTRAHNRSNRNGLCLRACQALIQTLKTVCQAFVVDAHQVQNRGIDVANMNGVPDDIVAEVVGFAMNDTTLDSAARHPHGVTARMVVPSIIVATQFTLAIN